MTFFLVFLDLDLDLDLDPRRCGSPRGPVQVQASPRKHMPGHVRCWEDTCHVSTECKTAGSALHECKQENGCTQDDDDAQEACDRQHCCNELKAAW